MYMVLCSVTLIHLRIRKSVTLGTIFSDICGKHTDLYHYRFTAAQRDLILHDLILDRIFQRGVQDGTHLLTAHEAHLQDPFPEGTTAVHLDDVCFLSCL